jgi:hypothetical protein
MITIRPARERGHVDHGWLDTYHTFSFADYHDPAHMGFRTLRVINDDRVLPGAGFGMHRHRDMEIVTWMLDGVIEHQDSMGHTEQLRPGEAQRMTAGRGIMHSEYNASRQDPLRLLQVWIEPKERGLAPGYEQRDYAAALASGALVPIAAPDGRDGAMSIHQDAAIYAARLPAGGRATHALAPERAAWVQVARGRITINGRTMAEGDGAAAESEDRIDLHAMEPSELLVLDLA